jgi:hypothetical protein
LDSVTPSTLQPWSSILRFLPVGSPAAWFKVWDYWHCDSYIENLAMLAGQGTVPTRDGHTHLFVGARL